MQLYTRCSLGTRVFPTFIKNDHIEKVFFINLYNYFNTKPLKSEKDYLIISSKTMNF